VRLSLSALARHSVFQNTGMLFLVQLLNYIMPLVLIPFLARMLGVELYGVYAFGMSIYLLGLMVVDYGFPRHALYEISEHKTDHERVNRLLGGMLVIKLMLFALIVTALVLFVLSTHRYAEHRTFLLLTALPLLGATLQFPWLFQGIEQSGRVFFYSLLARVLHVTLVVTIVGGPQDYLWVPIAHGIAQLVAAGVCIAMFSVVGYRIARPVAGEVGALLRAASGYFWARVAGANFGYMGVFVLGLVVAPMQLAVYAASEQLYRAIQALYHPLSDALIPYMRQRRDVRTFRIIFGAVAGVTLIGTVGSFVFAPQLIELLFGTKFADAVPILRIFLAVVPICVSSILIGYPLLGSLGHGETVNRIVIRVALAFMAALGLMAFTGTMSGITVALAIVLGEVAVFVALVKLGLRVRRAGFETGLAGGAR
jgi:PST family polysaccharide transporter